MQGTIAVLVSRVGIATQSDQYVQNGNDVGITFHIHHDMMQGTSVVNRGTKSNEKFQRRGNVSGSSNNGCVIVVIVVMGSNRQRRMIRFAIFCSRCLRRCDIVIVVAVISLCNLVKQGHVTSWDSGLIPSSFHSSMVMR